MAFLQKGEAQHPPRFGISSVKVGRIWGKIGAYFWQDTTNRYCLATPAWVLSDFQSRVSFNWRAKNNVGG